jgi:hypothetical protein
VILPEIGAKTYKTLFLFEKVEFAKDGYGYEKLLGRLEKSYLMIPEEQPGSGTLTRYNSNDTGLSGRRSCC